MCSSSVMLDELKPCAELIVQGRCVIADDVEAAALQGAFGPEPRDDDVPTGLTA